MSLIEEQLARLRREHEERKARFTLVSQESHASEAARAGHPGVLEIDDARASELVPRVATLRGARDAIARFNFNEEALQSFLEILLMGAAGLRASDIHWEPEESSVRIRYRIDGLLYDAGAVPRASYDAIIARVKLLSGMKLNADRPQDGRFAVHFSGRVVDIRVSGAPSQYGETFVLRVLDPATIHASLESLGLRADDLAIAREEIIAPNGMILNTGPTGSGKTTTLYAFLGERARPEIKIITIEDPIEYHIAGIEQTQVNLDAGYSFANGLKAIVRQDPDIMLIGEIRDQETAEIAIQAALTGHLVFSTIHANEAAGAISRLLDLNVKETSIGPAIHLIIGQRLVRRLCDVCKKPQPFDDALREELERQVAALPARVDRSLIPAIRLFEPVGCDACDSLGYRGRIGIFEFLRVDEEIEHLVVQKAGKADIERLAVERGMVTMREDGIIKALCGITTIEEVVAATGPLMETKK